jgi:hypothetical protein
LLVQVKRNQPTLHETLARLCAEHRPFDSHETGGVARSIDWSRCSTPAGYRVAAADRLRRPGLAPDLRDGHPLRPSREEIGCYACQIRLDADARALTGALRTRTIMFGMWARTAAGSGKSPAR